MKLKILPPTIREKKRYIAFDLFTTKNIKKNELINLLGSTLINLYGQIESGHINLWVINIKPVTNNTRVQYKGLIKCQRGYEEEVLLCLSSITHHKSNPLVIHTLSTSGTIKSLDDKYNLL
ncbi:MAG: hypothetical protein LUG89_01035 [Methanosphaera sp.]|nr:hypothetical protein [Methanosphaera sp.]